MTEKPDAGPLAKGVGERFEWLETWRDSTPTATAAEVEADLARRCPQCEWLDSITEAECFRCGHRFVSELTQVSGAAPRPSGKRRGAPVRVNFRHDAALLHGANDEPKICELRARVISLGLAPGFDQLLSLSEVNPEVFEEFEHQKAVAMRALRDLGGCALLADETGLGKTIEAALILKELLIRGLARTVLIVVPASLSLQWQSELAEKLEVEARVVRHPRDMVGEPPVVIVTYSALRGEGVGRLIREQPWDILICDEAHYLKNRSTKQYKAVNRIQKKYALLLSATPFHNKLLELKNLLDILKPGIFGSTRAFNKQYVDSKDPRKPINVHHLKNLLSEVMIRNRRSQVLVQLPPRKACIYHLELGEEERDLYDSVSRFISEEVKHLLGAHRPLTPQRLGRLAGKRGARLSQRAYSHVLALISLQRESCSSPEALRKTLLKMSEDEGHPEAVRTKLRALADRAGALGASRKSQALVEILESFEGKLLVFCEYRATLDSLVALVRSKGHETVAFHGGLTAKAKRRVLERFRDEARVMVTSRAGGEGLNIQFCQNMVNYDLPWNPMAVEQRIGRLHRLGQKHEVCVINLSVKDTIEARVLELLTHKIRLFTTVIGEIDLILGSLGETKSFEQLLQDSWIEGQLEQDKKPVFSGLSERLGQARSEFDELEESSKQLDRIAPEAG